MLGEEQVLIKNSVRAFVENRIAPNSTQFESSRGYPTSLFTELGELGLMGMVAPEAYGGAAADYVSYALALIELAAGDGALSTIVSIQNSLIVGGILKDGNHTQKEKYLPALISGEMIGAFALTEPDAGSDASAIRTRADKTDDGFILNGNKQFITSGEIAGLAMVIAVTDKSAGKRGMSVLLVETDQPGYHVDKIEDKLGQGASDTAAIHFRDLFVRENAILGQIGGGYTVALSNLETGRIGIAAQCVGMARAALDIAISYAKDRKSFAFQSLSIKRSGFD